MTYPININIPATNNDPADDQPLIRINFSNINSYLNIDHINPAAVGAGTHKQVTFYSNNVPTPPVSPPVLFTDTVAGLPQLKFYSGDSSHSSSQYVASTSGSTFLLGGIILKWGTTANLASGSVVGFPSAFPNNCYVVTAVQNSASPTPTLISVANLTTTGFQFYFAGGGTRTIYYVAVGN